MRCRPRFWTDHIHSAAFSETSSELCHESMSPSPSLDAWQSLPGLQRAQSIELESDSWFCLRDPAHTLTGGNLAG